MLKKDLQQLINNYDNNKGLTKRLFNSASEEMKQIKFIANQECVISKFDDELLPITAIYDLNQLINNATPNPKDQLTFDLLQQCSEKIKNYLTTAQDQKNDFDKIKRMIEEKCRSLKSAIHQAKTSLAQLSDSDESLFKQLLDDTKILNSFFSTPNSDIKKVQFGNLLNWAFNIEKFIDQSSVQDKHLKIELVKHTIDLNFLYQDAFELSRLIEKKSLAFSLNSQNRIALDNQKLINQVAVLEEKVQNQIQLVDELKQQQQKIVTILPSFDGKNTFHTENYQQKLIYQEVISTLGSLPLVSNDIDDRACLQQLLMC